MQEQASCPEGSEHRASGLRMAPEGLVTPSGPPRPDLNSRGLAKHFRSRARLRRLLVRLRRPTLHRPRCGLRQGGFAHYVRLRHYRSSLFCYSKIIPSHSFAALTALVVRRGKGDVALLMCRVKGIAALFVRSVSGDADRPMPCLCWLPARPPQGHWRAHPAAAPCRSHFLQIFRSRRLQSLLSGILLSIFMEEVR